MPWLRGKPIHFVNVYDVPISGVSEVSFCQWFDSDGRSYWTVIYCHNGGMEWLADGQDAFNIRRIRFATWVQANRAYHRMLNELRNNDNGVGHGKFLRSFKDEDARRACPSCEKSEGVIGVFNGYIGLDIQVGGCVCPSCGYYWTEHAHPNGDVFMVEGHYEV